MYKKKRKLKNLIAYAYDPLQQTKTNCISHQPTDSMQYYKKEQETFNASDIYHAYQITSVYNMFV